MIRLLHIIIICFCSIPAFAQVSQCQSQDSVEFYLITCYPGKEVYNIYGHTAIRYRNFTTSQDLTFNYGIFNFKQKNFVLKFAMGETYYELGVIPYDLFIDNYIAQGRKVVSQRLNLTTQQKKALFLALYENAMPENKTYLYNFLFDNCCTRARDIIYSAINSDSCHVANARAKANLSWRRELHNYTKSDTWAEVGNDLAMGAGADRIMVDDENEFLPLNLFENFSNSKIVYSTEDAKANAKAIAKPLVFDTEVLYDGSEKSKYSEPYPSPMTCCIFLFIILLIITIAEFKRKRMFFIVDRILYVLLGLAGCLLFVLAISRHPLTGYNLNMLVFNPLFLVAVFFIDRKKFRKAMSIYFLMTSFIISLGFFIIQEVPLFTIALSASMCFRHITYKKGNTSKFLSV